MTICLVGLSHQTAPINIREKLYISPKKTGDMLSRIKNCDGVSEVVILSTCNRTEIYAVCVDQQPVIDLLCSLTDPDNDDVKQFLYIKNNAEVASHLFRVTAGLESMAIGEDQIQGQVATALQLAQTHKSIGKQLNNLFQYALSAGKKIRTMTTIGNGETALSRIATDLITATFPEKSTLSVLLIGAGDIAEATAKYLSQRHAHIVFVANRTYARAVELAKQFDGEAVNFNDIDQLLAKCDVVISSTAAPHHVITAASVAHAMQMRGNNPLHLIDLALPRDIEPQAGDLPFVFLHNLDDLQITAQIYKAQQQQEIQHAELLLGEEIQQWCIRQSEGEISGAIAALHAHFENIRSNEIKAMEKQLDDFTPKQREIVNTLTQSIIKKLLHNPTVCCKEHYSQCGDNTTVEILSELFGLSDNNKDDE